MDDFLYLGLGLALFALAGWLVRERRTPPVEVPRATTPPAGGPR